MRILLPILLLSALLAPATAAAPLFEADYSAHSVPLYASSVSVGDLDEDGIPDLVSGSRSYGYLCLLRGLGGGAFALVDSFQIGGVDVEVADLDLDGHLDIVAAEYGIRAMLGNGDLTFEPAVEVVAGAVGGYFVELADLTGDLIPDLVNRSALPNEVMVLAGLGNGSFGAPVSHALPLPVYDLMAADLDGDGDVDLAVQGYDNGPPTADALSVLLNPGNGGFGPPVTYPTGRSIGVATGDVDGDGVRDLVCGEWWLRGLGAGAFADTVSYSAYRGGYLPAVGDMDLDGIDDVLAMSQSELGYSIAYHRALGGGAFAPPVSIPTSNYPTSLIVADLDGDPYPDFATTAYTFSSVCVHRMLGARGPQLAAQVPTLVNPVDVLLTDITGDGLLDALVASPDTSALQVHPGRGDRTFDPPFALATGQGVKQLAAGDFDSNGAADVVAALVGGGIAYFPGTGGGTFAARVDLPTPVVVLVVADIGQDGYDDLVAASSALWVFPGGPAGLGVRTDYVASGSRIAAGRLDGDAYPDVALASASTVLVLRGQSGGTLGPPAPYVSSQSSDGGIALLDLDDDGDLDIVTAPQLTRRFGYLINAGDASFASAPASGRPHRCVNLETGDIDLDGRVDVVTSGEIHGVAAAFLNRGAGPVAIDAGYGSSDRVSDAALGDLDGDGAPELVAANVVYDNDEVSNSITASRLLVMRNTRGRLLDARPAAPPSRLALATVWPNPARAGGRAQVAFTVPARAEVTLELYDLGGRRLTCQALGARVPGRHTHELALAPGWSPGLYWVRVAQGEAAAVRRVVVTR